MNYFWANQKSRAPNDSSNGGTERNSQALNGYPLQGGHSRTPQSMPQRAQIHPSPPISGQNSLHRPQIPRRFTSFTQGRYQDLNIVDARTTQPTRIPFPSATATNNTISLILAARYGRVLPFNLPNGPQYRPRNTTSIGNSAVFTSLTSYGNSFNLDVVNNSFNGGIGNAPNGFSNSPRPNFAPNSFSNSLRPTFATNGFSNFPRPNFATDGFSNSRRPNTQNNKRNIFFYGENSNNSSRINNFINNPRTRVNMNNFCNQRNILSFNGNSNNSFGFTTNNFLINPSTSVKMNNNFIGLENVVMPFPTPPIVNDLELVRNPSTNVLDLARERALKRPLTLTDVGQENEGSKRRRPNDYYEGQQSQKKELLLFNDSDEGEKNLGSTFWTATEDGRNGNGNGNDEEKLDLSLHL